MRLAQLERHHASLERKVASNADTMATALEAQLQALSYSNAAQQQVHHVGPGGIAGRNNSHPSQPTVEPPRRKSIAADVGANARTAPNGQQHSSTETLPVARRSNVNATSLHAAEPSSGDTTSVNTAAGDDDDNFQMQRHQRIREKKQEKKSTRQAVYGSGSAGSLKAGKLTREVFVLIWIIKQHRMNWLHTSQIAIYMLIILNAGLMKTLQINRLEFPLISKTVKRSWTPKSGQPVLVSDRMIAAKMCVRSTQRYHNGGHKNV